MSSIIDQMIDEELKIRQHPNKDMIISAIGDPNFLVTFSDVNKVGINPKTKFNTPAGIYGWHFTQNTIDGAKKNKLFASGRDYGHLMKIRDGAKVLWLGDDGKTGAVPSREEVNSAIAKKYPAFIKDTFPVYEMPDTSKPMGSGAPPIIMMAHEKDSDRVSFVSPQKWLEDPKHVETLSKVSQREYGGSTESEKLYDYVQAAAKALENATDKKITIISNGILRALGYDAVIDADGRGIIHKAEKEQGFFTHRGALDHVATILNRKYVFRESTLYKLLREPGVPMDKKAAALKNLLGTGPKIAPGGDPQFDPEFDRSDIFDTLDYITADTSVPFTPEMIKDMLAWTKENYDVSPLLGERILQKLHRHPGMTTEMLEAALKKEQKPEVYVGILRNPNAPEKFLMGVYFDNIVLPVEDPQISVLENPNVPQGLLNTEADRYSKSSTIGKKGRWGNGQTSKAERARKVLENPGVSEEAFNKIVREEDGSLDMNKSLTSAALRAKNVPMSYYNDLFELMRSKELTESQADELLFDVFLSKYTPEEVVLEAFENYEEWAGASNWRVSAKPLLKFALQGRYPRKPSQKFLQAMKDIWDETRDEKKFLSSGSSEERTRELFKKFGVKISEGVDLRSLINQTINETISQERIRQVNEKLYEEYAECLGEDMRTTFWDLPEEGKNFVIEDWIGQGKPGQSLAEQLFGSRAELEQPFQQLNEISSEVYDAVVDAAEDLSTEEMRPLFGNNERVIIPMASEENEQVKEFYEQIVEPLAAKGIKVDLKNGVATKEIETQRGKQERKTKLGKTIGRELSAQAQTWWNKFQADFLGNPDVLEAQDAIVITQHPVDVARMSDFSEADIESCHSQGSDYFRCALADAKRAGAIAYLINGEDVPYAQEHINDNELFADSERDVDGIIPKARVRLRRFDNVDLASEGAPLALLAPETRVYGTKVPGFLSTVSAWARKVQKGHPVFDEKLDLRKFVLRGGSYMDSTSKSMFNTLLGKDEYTQEDYGTRTAQEEDDVAYDDGQRQMMLDSAADAMEGARYYLDDENVDYDFGVDWDDWNESVEVRYSIKVQFDYPVYKFIGSPNVGSKEDYSEEEMISALRRQAAMGAIRDIAENTYDNSDNYDQYMDYTWSASIKDRGNRFSPGKSRLVVEVVAYIEGVTHDPENFESEVASNVKSYFVDYWEDIDKEIENALKEDGWMVQQPYDRIKVDPEDVQKLGPESFDLFKIVKDTDRGIKASMINTLKGYPDAGTRTEYSTISDEYIDIRYAEGPKLVEIIKETGEKFTMEGGILMFPPERRNNVLKAIKKDIMDAARAAASQPSLPLDLPDGENKDVERFLPAVDEVQVGLKQAYKPGQPYRRKGEPEYGAQGGIIFTFKPSDTQEQIDTNLKFVKYLDDNPGPIHAAIQKEWDEVVDNFNEEMPMKKEEPKQEEEPAGEPSHMDAYKESVSYLRNLIKETLTEAKFENETTKIAREIMSRVTAHLDHYGEPRVPHRYMANENDLQGFGYGGYGQPKVPETLKAEGVNAIVVKLGVEPSTAFAEGSKFASTGQARMRDDEDGRDRMIIIDVALSDAFTQKDLSLLNARVKNTIAHELTHGGQGEDILTISGNAQKEAFRLGMKTIEGIRSYYLDPAEVEAFARGIYKQAKMTKTPFHEMVSAEIERSLNFYTHPKELARVEFSEEEVRSFFEEDYRQALLAYAKANLPAAVIEGLIRESMEDEDYDGVDSIDYKGEHSAPMAEDGAPLWNITANGVYPDDVYGPNGMSWYGTGDRFLDSEAYSILRKAHGRRDKQLTVYRAVPKGVKGINRGDWVTTVRQYAKDHGESALNGEYSIIKKSVTARDIFTDGNSWLEWGYDPQPRIPYSEREDWERYPGKKK